MALRLITSIDLPRHSSGGFDHGDVYLSTGRVFVAHTAAGTVEIIDGEEARHLATVPGCSEASGIVCAEDAGLVFAAARGDGKVLVIDAATGELRGDLAVGPKPNGLAWDPGRRRVLVADVQDLHARLVTPDRSRSIVNVLLPGRPRWCVYDAALDRFLVNIREPACMVGLDAETGGERDRWPVSRAGPHGLDLDASRNRAFVACDEGSVVDLDLATGRELATVEITGAPDVVWHNARAHRLYVAIGCPGVIDVIDTDGMRRVDQITTEAGAHTAAFDHARQRLYVFLPMSCRAAVYEEVMSQPPRTPDAAWPAAARRGAT